MIGFDPTLGREIQKTRPAVVIQNDVSNQYSPITIVAAISDSRTSSHSILSFTASREGGSDKAVFC